MGPGRRVRSRTGVAEHTNLAKTNCRRRWSAPAFSGKVAADKREGCNEDCDLFICFSGAYFELQLKLRSKGYRQVYEGGLCEYAFLLQGKQVDW